ncbi:MAG: hypothetical protein KGH74_03545 [Candidatus Micrarchaeota archaeon]|nr:hypothetical protein [Candidatus Micrarchaeota archaeon]
MVMHAREIPECVQAISKLEIPKVWFRAMNEKQLEVSVPRFIEQTNFDNYIMLSDDTIPTQKALDEVRKWLAVYPVVSGWCLCDPKYDRSNVLLKPSPGRALSLPLVKQLPLLGAGGGRVNSILKLRAYVPYSLVMHQPVIFPGYYMGFFFTGLRRRLWQRFPFQTYGSRYNSLPTGSDFILSEKLRMARIPMMIARDAYVHHLHTMRGLLIGKETPSVRFEL